MRIPRIVIVLGLAAVVLVGAACNPPLPAHPYAGTSKFLCCNVHYEKNEINDNWFQVGTPIKAGTRVQIMEVRKNSVLFQAEGHPPIRLELKYGEKLVAFDDYLRRVFPDTNPLLKFGKKKSKLEQAAIDGRVEPGMTRDQVILAIGYPPAHMTPSLEQDSWHYWTNRWHQYYVIFSKGKVDRVNQ